MLKDDQAYAEFLESLCNESSGREVDPMWEQVKFEARATVEDEPEAAPSVYQGILSHSCLTTAIVTVLAHTIETDLTPATEVKNLILDLVTPEDEVLMRMDLEAAATRSPDIENAMATILFHNGFQALVAYRAGHRLWQVRGVGCCWSKLSSLLTRRHSQAGRTGLAYYIQSTVSRVYSADIHPACRIGYGTYLRVGAGVVIGETAVIGNDVSILEGVTLGGTGKVIGDRHPKVGNGVILEAGATVLGSIVVGDGSIVKAKAIVTKAVPPLAIMRGVPAKIAGYRKLEASEFDSDLCRHLPDKYMDNWANIIE